MTPAEVLAMRDRLAEWLMIEKEAPSRDMAEALIASGWVTNEAAVALRNNVQTNNRKDWE